MSEISSYFNAGNYAKRARESTPALKQINGTKIISKLNGGTIKAINVKNTSIKEIISQEYLKYISK